MNVILSLFFVLLNSNTFYSTDKTLVETRVDAVVEESIALINKSLNKEVQVEPLKEAVSKAIVNDLNPFIQSMNLKMDECLDIPETVPLLDQGTLNPSKETLETMQGQFDELMRTYMRVIVIFLGFYSAFTSISISFQNKYLLDATKAELEQYKEISEAAGKEEAIYQKVAVIANDFITVKDLEKSVNEIDK